MVLDNDDDHEPALGTSRSPRWCMRIVDDERSRFGDFFLSMGGEDVKRSLLVTFVTPPNPKTSHARVRSNFARVLE